MRLTKEQKAAHRATFRNMSPAEKLEYVWEYYKWPILLTLLALGILIWAAHREFTKKEPVLHLALVNVTVGEDLEQTLTTGYLTASDRNPRRQEVYVYRDLYLSDDADVLNHVYAYASRTKVMGAVQTQKLDVVLMNREAYDLLSAQGYLLPLDDSALTPFLTSNEVVVSDNAIEWQLNGTHTSASPKPYRTHLRCPIVPSFDPPALKAASMRASSRTARAQKRRFASSGS